MTASFLLSFRRSARPVTALGVLLGVCAALLGACVEESEPLFERVEPLDTNVARPGNLPTFPAAGSGGRGATGAATDGVRGEAIAGLISVDAGAGERASGLSADAGADAGGACQLDVECDDGNECTLDECRAGSCRSPARAAGTACGSAEPSECSLPGSCDGAGSCLVNFAPAATPCGRGTSNGCTADVCDGAGTCQAVDVPAGTTCGSDGGGCSTPSCDGAGSCEPREAPNGSACPGGSCSLGACVAGQPVGCPAALTSEVPVQLAWSSAGLTDLVQGSCDDSLQTPDFALVFNVPQTGEYRIDAQGSQDSVLVVRAGACDGNQLACNDDLNVNNRNSRVELLLIAGQTITIYVSEFGNGSNGQGTLSISLL